MSNYRLNPLENIDENRDRIIENTKYRMNMMVKKPQRNSWKPALITIFACLLFLVIASPYLQQTFQGENHFSIRKVVIPHVPYDSLIKSFYIDESNELIYSTDQGIYSFNVEKDESKQLVNTHEIGRVFELTASAKWLIWVSPVHEKKEIHILNRKNNELKTVENKYFYGLHLSGDTLIYLGSNQGKTSYLTMALDSLKESVLHEMKGEGANSQPAIDKNLIVIPETLTINKEKETMVYVYDFRLQKQIATYTFPYKIAQNIQIQNDTIFAYLLNGKDPGVLGLINMYSGKFEVLYMPVVSNAYATDGRYFALSVARNESDTVQLFREENNKLQIVSTLPSIKERLVKPRFTSEGTFLLNGEGKDLAMYIIQFDE
ncbi:hypothetical protein [Pseudoneobacillus sp. C159]